MAEIRKIPDRSPRKRTTMVTKENIRSYGKPSRFDTLPEQTKRALALNKPVPANQNLTRMQRAKEAVAKGMTRAAGPVGAAVRGGLRAAGPVGALVGMTTPAGAPEESASIKREKSYGPLMRGGMQPGYTYKGGVSVPTRGMSGPPKSMPSRPTAPATKSTGPSRGPTSAPVRTAPSKPATSTTKSTGPSRGPTSAPARTQPSKANLGTSRFSKGGSVKRRKK